MGVERTVTLWYLHRQMLLGELASLEAELVQIPTASSFQGVQPETSEEAEQSETEKGREEQRKRVQERLRNLGPCPRAMMG
jgi:hypothetical protein